MQVDAGRWVRYAIVHPVHVVHYSSRKPREAGKYCRVIRSYRSNIQHLSSNHKDAILGEGADIPWMMHNIQSQVPIPGLDTEGLSELGTKTVNSADRLQQHSVRGPTSINAGRSSTITDKLMSYNTHHHNSQHIPITTVSPTQMPALGKKGTTAHNTPFVTFRSHYSIGLGIDATHDFNLNDIIHTQEETQVDTLFLNQGSQSLFQGGATGSPGKIGTAATALSSALQNSEEPSMLLLTSHAFKPNPYSTISDNSEPLEITSLFFPELMRITSQDSLSTAGVEDSFISGKLAMDSPGPEGRSCSTVKTYQEAASADHQPYFIASTPITGSASHSKAVLILHTSDTDQPGTISLLQTQETALFPSPVVDSYGLSSFQHLATRSQFTPGLFQNIGAMKSSTAISFRGSSGQKIQSAIETDTYLEHTPNLYTFESKSVLNTAGMAFAKDNQIQSSTWTSAPGSHSMNSGQPDATNLEFPLPSILSDSTGSSTNVVPETCAGVPSPGGSVSSNALHDAAASYTVNKRSALVSIGVISGAACLSLAIFEWARRRSIGRGNIQVDHMKARNLRRRDPNRSYFSLDSRF